MKNILFLLLLLLSFSNASVDRAAIDSVNALERDYIFSNIRQSIVTYKKTIEEARDLGYGAGEVKALQNLGVALYLRGDYDESVNIYLQAIRLSEKLNLPQELAYAYGDLGYQMKRRDLSRAKDYMRRGITIAEKHNFSQILCALYDNYGVIQELSDHPDSAKYFYKQSLRLKTALSDSLGIPFSLNNLAGIYLAENDYDNAADFLRKSDRYRKKEKNNYGRLVNTVRWGDFYFQRNNLDSAKLKYMSIVNIPDAFEQNYLVSYCYKQLTKIYEKSLDYQSAYENQKKFETFKDSLINLETNKRIADLEIEYETEKKDHQLAVNRLEIAQRDRQLILLGGFIVLLMMISAGVYKYQRLKHKQIKKEMELKTQLKHVEFEQKIADEKLRISQELHDNIGSQLTFMIGTLDNLKYSKEKQNHQNALDEVSNFGRLTLNELRNTVWAIKQEEVDFDAFLLRLNDLKRHFGEERNNISLKIENQVQNSIHLSSIQILNLLRIAQESLQNSIKHAQATQVMLILKSKDAKFQFIIRDNGSGFDVEKTEPGNGLINMKQRCERNGGKFSINSNKNGTEIKCLFETK